MRWRHTPAVVTWLDPMSAGISSPSGQVELDQTKHSRKGMYVCVKQTEQETGSHSVR